MKNNRTELSRRVRYALLAGMAGAFLIPQVGFAAPTGEHVTYGGATVGRAGNDTNINSTTLNNVIEWKDYSLKSTERVVHDSGAKTNNYLNIVTGANTSNINGKIVGGKDVYIVNPNGVIFGKTAEVDVGNLYVSTQDTGSLNRAAFEITGSSGASPLVNTAALKADVVNMGKIKADTVEVHGSHIRFLNAADVTATNPVVLYTDAPAASPTAADGGYAHIGYRGTAPTNYTSGAGATPEYYQLVKDTTELSGITANLSGKYMLEQDIDYAGGTHTPIGTAGTPFTGKFDGNLFRIKNFIADNPNRAGLFGALSGARIENLGVTGATITGGHPASNYAGGIAASATGSLIKNVYVKDSVITSKKSDGTTGAGLVGGIVGLMDNTTIDSAYAKNRLGGNAGGIVGATPDFSSGSLISNSYNDSEPIIAPGIKSYFIHLPGDSFTHSTTITNSYNVGLNFSSNKLRLSGGLNNVYELDTATNQMRVVEPVTLPTNPTRVASTAAASYSGWSINNTGEPGAKWRIYEGRTLPLLTAFMGVSSEATYNYRYFNGVGTASTAAANTPKTNNGADMKDVEYNSYYLKIVDKNSPNAIGGKSNVTFGAGADTSGVKDYVSGNDLNTTNGIRNVGTKAMLWTDQDGPNLRGVNVTIKPRVVSLKNSSLSPSRMYNGKSDVTKVFREALTSGGIGSTGFTAEDIANGSVALDFTTGSFKAWAVDGSNNPDRNVGTNKPVKFSGSIGFSGPDAGNYDFDTSSLSNLTGSVTITKAPLYLSIQKKTADDKTYDGTSTVVDSAMLQTNTPPNITLDKSKAGLTLAQINAGTPAMPDGAIMTGDNDTTPDDVNLTTVGGPKYTNASGVEQLHAGTHKLQYTNVGLQGNDAGNYELYYTPANNTKTLVSTTDKTVYLDGKIVPREILRDNFNVYDKTTHAKLDAKKVYDGNDEYTPSSNVYISSNAVTGGTTGLVERDRDHITFALTGGKGHFAQNDGTTYSKNVQDVEKLAYEVTGHTDDDTNYKLSDYYIMDGGVQKSLGSTFHATGAGKITPKALTATVKNNHITKVYDAMDDQTDGNRNITRGDDLVTLSGWVAGDTVRTNTSTAKYASPNVVWDGVNNRATTQGVTYTASFNPGTGVESQNYTLGAEGVTPISTTKALTGSYTGTITPRPLGIKFADVTKVYDGTTNNPTKTITDIDDSVGVAGATKGAVTSVDGTTTTSLSAAAMANVTSTYNDANAGTGKTVTYTNLSGLLSNHNYSIADSQTGTGTITRRLIENSGFQVRKTGGTLANATKVYDGTNTFTLAGDEYLVAKPSTDPSATPGTGIVAKDVPNIVFKMTGNEGHFLKSGSGTAVSDRTSHVSEAARVAYGVYAETLDGTTSPLSNYEFGTTISKRNLEAVTTANPDAVTAVGRITPAKIQATTREISKLYDGVAEHTDGNRNVLRGDTIVGLNLFTDATGQPTNTSTAVYADKNVARDAFGNVIKKNVTYKAQLTGQYANDYEIVDAGNNVISTRTGAGAAQTVTATITPSAATGTINPRKLKITMNDVTKTYDGTAANTSATITGITDDPTSTVINTILSGDSITASTLQTTYRGMLTANTASSNYGRLSGTNFATNANASNGTPHDVQYANMDEAFRSAFSAVVDNYDVAKNVYSKGTINRKAITPNTFKVSGGKATKVYDGTSAYTVPAGSTLTANTGELVGTDASKIQFAISGNGAKFTKTDGVTETANVADARKVAYNITVSGDSDTIRNYTLNGQNLESGNLTASGDGEITRRALNLNLVQSTGIDKEYDGQTTLKNTATKNWNALTDADPKGNVQYAAGSTAANKLVTTDGTSFNITSNYMNNAGTVADKNVRRDGSNNPIDKTIQYRVTINGDANNYSFDGGATSAASGLTLSATGTITPKDLSGAFKKVTKVYDRTTNVPPGLVGFTPGATIAGDVVNLATHTEAFHSANVNGDGTTWTPSGGTEQKNWVEYSGLTLGGTDAGNYNLSSTARGLGEITPLALNPSSINFNIGQATKEYDGTTTVKHNNSTAMTDVKNYIASATTTVNSTTVDVLPELSVDAATYDTKDVDGGRSANRVTYTLKYTGASGNFTIGSGTFTKQGNGVITKKDVTATVKSPVSKVYDATTTLTGVAKDSANAVVTNANDLIGMTGFTGNDGATYTTTAVYADKNVGTGKQVDYTLTLNGAAAGNYNLKYGGANSSGTFSTNDNTITKRKVDVTFADVTKTYDTTPTNTSITGTVSAADKAVLNTDSAGLVNGSNALTNLSTLNSQYGTGTGASFTANPNAGTNKDVRYQGLGAQMGTTLGANAANYEFDADGYGKGTITRATINPSDVTFATTNATKVYDGTQAVKHNGSAAMGDVKNYITNAMWNGHDILSEFAVSSAQYNTTANVNGGASQGVTYNMALTGTNNNIQLGSGNFTANGTGVITPKDVDVTVKSPLTKVYDATTAVKDAGGNPITGSALNNLLTLTGLTGNDGATYTTTAVYADKNAGTGKQVNYTLTMNGAAADNYNLKRNGANIVGNAFSTNDNTITKRTVDVAFADVSKTYDTTPTNNSITPRVSSTDAAVLALDSSGNVSGRTITGLTGVTSQYGTGTTDATFAANPNAGTNKSVQYAGIGAAMGTVFGTNNYEFAANGYGKGTINRATINPGDVNFTVGPATKVYDGTRTVKHNENAAPSAVKNYITRAMWNGHDILNEFAVSSAQYDTTANVNGGASQGVTYNMALTGTNNNIQLGSGSLTASGTGVITPKDVDVTVNGPLSKVYDATTAVKDAGGNPITGNALNNLLTLTGLTGNDGATYTTTAQYANKNAGTGKQVNYTLTMNGAAAGNYNLKYGGANSSGAFSTNDNTITKRTVDVTFNPVTKSYDGTPTNNSITPRVSSADAAVLALDSSGNVSGTTITGLTGVTSQYGTGTTDATFAANPNAGTNKSVQYAGIGTAMGTVFGANNYDFATNVYGTGTITKANINTSDITFTTTGAHKVYDGTRTVKYNGSGASDQVKNYITQATANLGGGHTADLRGDLEIDTAGTKYASSNAGTGIGVTYKFRLNNNNIEISGRNEFEMTDTGTIDRRVLNLDLTQKTGIDKIYDANAGVVDTVARKYKAFTDDDALGNVTYAAGTTDDNKLVRTSNGASVNDGATMTIRANYVNAGVADKNVARDGGGNVAAKDIAYRVSIDAANGGQNYKLSDGVTTVDAETGLNLSARGTITPRELTLGFADVSKPYDTTAVNNTKNINSIVAADSDGRGAATLTADNITNATFDMTNVGSLYGAGNTDATFQSDPNVVTDADGNVVPNGKDVQYTNIRSTLSGTNANNYTVANTAYGKGTIRKRVVSVNDFDFNISKATKMYDGTDTVYWHDNAGNSYSDLGHVKQYFRGSTLDLGGGNTVPINLDDIELNSAKYNDVNASPSTSIDYGVRINAKNFEFNGGHDRTIHHTGDEITKRNLATMLPKHLVKEYDGEDTFTETNTVFANAMANENLTPIVERDRGLVHLAVAGQYDDKHASAETRAEAEARTPATAGKNVAYTLTLSGDATRLTNYEIDGQPLTNTVNGKADIYKKTLTVGVDNIDKLYDGTRTVVRPNGTGTLPHPEAGKFRLSGFVGSESFGFDQTAADKIDGLYSDANVSRRNGAVVDKDIAYSGLQNAFADNATRDTTGYARNYRIDGDTLSGKGKINPRPITANEITNGLTFDKATKVYDGTRAVKYNGQNTPDALKNYLTSATVNVDGTPIDIRNDLTIRADEAYTHYDTQHVAGGAQPRVTYGLSYTGGNFDISGDLTKQADGVITKRKVMAYAPGQLTKIYDGTNKVYDPTDTSIKTYRRGTRVTDGDSIVRMSTEDGDTGLLANDGVRNISTATFDDKNVGKRKKVTYNVGVDAAHAGDYEIVDTLGNTISELTTRNNEITPRRLDLTFGDVNKSYDATSTNDDTPTTFVTDSDTRKTLQKDHARIFGNELILQDGAGNDLTLPSDYGYGRTDRTFAPDANADTDKSVQYRNMGDALRTILGDNAKNYEFDETGYGKGTINKANVRESDFDFRFNDAEKEYDGTSAVADAMSHLDKGTSRVRLPRSAGWKNYNLPDTDIAGVTGTYMSADGRTPDKNAADRKIVNYKVQLNDRNFAFEGGWNGVVEGEGRGKIERRAITAAQLPYLTKTYDGTNAVVNAARDAEGNLITGSGDALMQFRHVGDATQSALIAGDDVTNATTATYGDANVAWKDDAWKNGHGDVADKDVNYTLTLSGADAANYKIVDSNGNEVSSTVGKGRIDPKDIHLKSDSQTRWINEGLPDSYTGTPTGSNYETGVNGEALPGEIYYDTPNGKLRWGDYAINGYYRASDKARYQRPDGSRYQLADGTPDGDSVARNYRFVQDPANATALHIGPYVPDHEYYNALTQVSKMTPDEYAYENASLDRRNHFGRDLEAEVIHTPPSVNTVKDGVDITKTGIQVTDETVFKLMNEVFGA